MKWLLILALAIVTPSCSYATGTIHPDGSLTFSVFRPYLEKPKIHLVYNPETKLLDMSVDTEVEHLDAKALGTIIGAAVAAAAKSAVIP